jgi:hypothetical protein
VKPEFKVIDEKTLLDLFKLAAENKEKLNTAIDALIDELDKINKYEDQRKALEEERRINKIKRKEQRFKDGVDIMGNKILPGIYKPSGV